VLALLVAIVVVLFVLSRGTEKEAAHPLPENGEDLAPTGLEAVSGEKIYNQACRVCHESGVAGAPRTGDEAAWASRIDQGMETLLKNTINGKNAMPPRGTCAGCSVEELKAAIEFMVDGVQ
jgi:cytochrome c5